MSQPAVPDAPRRGRPPRDPARAEARQALMRAGLAELTERGYSAAGLDRVLRRAGVPKGSFYHYFRDKADFGAALIDAYDAHFAAWLDRTFTDPALPPLARLHRFTEEAEAGMARHGFRRGCLVGNLGQEMNALPEVFRARLTAVLDDWQDRTARLLAEAQAQGQLAPHHDPATLARMFWIGWEGAVLRAKLDRTPDPLRLFARTFLSLIHP